MVLFASLIVVLWVRGWCWVWVLAVGVAVFRWVVSPVFVQSPLECVVLGCDHFLQKIIPNGHQAQGKVVLNTSFVQPIVVASGWWRAFLVLWELHLGRNGRWLFWISRSYLLATFYMFVTADQIVHKFLFIVQVPKSWELPCGSSLHILDAFYVLFEAVPWLWSSICHLPLYGSQKFHFEVLLCQTACRKLLHSLSKSWSIWLYLIPSPAVLESLIMWMFNGLGPWSMVYLSILVSWIVYMVDRFCCHDGLVLCVGYMCF